MDRRLYEEDFYLWTAAQAEALRAEGARAAGQGRKGQGSNAIDWDLVAEEVEDLGKSDRNSCLSLATQILVHFYKLAWTRRAEPRGHWMAEVLAFRDDLAGKLTPSLRAVVVAELERLHTSAAKRASLMFSSEEPGAPTDPDLRWTLEQVLGEADDPVA